jgi:hypothetical protein
MSKTIILENSDSAIQTAPPYTCPHCGASIRQVLRYNDYRNPAAARKPLDDFGEHLQYLNCTACHTCTRVVRLGDVILPFRWPDDVDAEGEARIVAQGIARIIEMVGPQDGTDPAAGIVYRLLAGVLAPGTAITEIRELVHAAEVPEPEPEYIFQHQVEALQ